MGRVRDLVAKRKNHETFFINENDNVRDAIRSMAKLGVGAIGVVGESKQLVGIFSERDLSRRVVLEGCDPDTTKIKDVMTRTIVAVGMDDDLEQCQSTMFQAGIRHLAVVEGSNFRGLLSLRDFLHHDVAEKEDTIRYLKDYLFYVPDDAL
ncbi:MAG TPA: CBS domain-containing protein [Thermoanaerobaculia bacterium]|nr:CBS domain-containing protein [Thermoanaerobaculia bacterium]HUM29871.1 CBS domain-containing protein [Thermoanaerobaculia bacterium]HXK68146.1 CBS domain-containing protein [Thermoanaerobaculia bacterium]